MELFHVLTLSSEKYRSFPMVNSSDRKLSPAWQKVQVLSIIIASLAVPIIVAIVGNSYSNAQKQRDIGARYVEIAAEILRSEPAKESKALRSWAISVVDYFAPIKFSAEATDELETIQIARLEEMQNLVQFMQSTRVDGEKYMKEIERLRETIRKLLIHIEELESLDRQENNPL